MMPEAVHSIDKLDLVLCSDSITTISLSQCNAYRSKADNAKKRDLISCYRRRDPADYGYSLNDYFYKRFCREVNLNRKEHRILMASGLNCRPAYPVDFYYARGMLYLHKPWNKDNTLDSMFKDKERTIKEFHSLLESPTTPVSVKMSYELARVYSQEAKIECIAKQGVLQPGDINMEDLDEDQREEYLEHMNLSRKTDILKSGDVLNDIKTDLGRNYDWTTKTFHETRDVAIDGRNYLNELQELYYNNQGEDSNQSVHVPTRKDGGLYSIDNLNREQEIIVCAAVDAIVKFLRNDPDYRPFRATVLGCGGTGKSFIINTILSIIRTHTQCDDSIKVAAPSGGAAYNVQGCTLHRLLNIPIEKSWEPLSEVAKKDMRRKLKNLLALVVDERSMIDSKLIAAAEKNTRLCAFGGQNSREYWGGLPVVILFGDDYQLPPVGNQGAINGYARLRNDLECIRNNNASDGFVSTKQHKQSQLLRHHGDTIFVNLMTENVFLLTQNMRVSEHMTEFRDHLSRLRTGDPILPKETSKGTIPGDDEQWCNLKLQRYDKAFRDELENREDTAWLYWKNEDRVKQNNKKLRATSEKFKVPIASMNCHYESNRQGGIGPFRDHFCNVKNFERHTDICLHATVAIDGVNFIPEIGLYNGARGKVVEIVYDKPEGPNDKQHRHLPAYVVVDFPRLNLPKDFDPWDKNHKTVRCQSSTMGANVVKTLTIFRNHDSTCRYR